jgi:CDP-glycerol glycerophosphotransferase
VPDGKRLALYVPTWRDDQHDASGAYRLDFRLDLDAAGERLAAEWVLAIRGHHLMASGLPAAGTPPFCINVTDYPDISDLLIASDVLITDYSSVIFDFVPTGRPVVLFTYDLARYRDHIRGFCLDLEAEAPGPLVATSEQVVAALADIDAVAARHEPARAAFAAKYCPLDDGKAAARACDALLGD